MKLSFDRSTGKISFSQTTKKTKRNLRQKRRNSRSSLEFKESSETTNNPELYQNKRTPNFRKLTSSRLDKADKELSEFLLKACRNYNGRHHFDSDYPRTYSSNYCYSFQPLDLEIPMNIGQKTNLLELNVNGVKGIIPPSLCSLSNLETLALQNGNLRGTIPSRIGNLKSLTHLILSNNKLTESIPNSLFTISTLKSILLDNNNLSGSLPKAVFTNLLHLQTLNVSNNKNLEGRIPEEVGNLKFLNNLMFAETNIRGVLPLSIENCKRLETLELPTNKLDEDPVAITTCELYLDKKIPKDCYINIFHDRRTNRKVFNVMNTLTHERQTEIEDGSKRLIEYINDRLGAIHKSKFYSNQKLPLHQQRYYR